MPSRLRSDCVLPDDHKTSDRPKLAHSRLEQLKDFLFAADITADGYCSTAVCLYLAHDPVGSALVRHEINRDWKSVCAN